MKAEGYEGRRYRNGQELERKYVIQGYDTDQKADS